MSERRNPQILTQPAAPSEHPQADIEFECRLVAVRGYCGREAHGVGWDAVFEGVAGYFGDGEHKIVTAGDGQPSASSVTAYNLA